MNIRKAVEGGGLGGLLPLVGKHVAPAASGTILLDGIRVIGDITVDEGEAIELGAAKNGKP